MSSRRAASPARYRVNGGVAHREIEGQVLLLGTGASRVMTLNETGRFVWRRVVRRRTTDEIVRALRRSFGVSERAAAEDVGAFLRALEAGGFIVRIRS